MLTSNPSTKGKKDVDHLQPRLKRKHTIKKIMVHVSEEGRKKRVSFVSV
jgi:hypothetical protein